MTLAETRWTALVIPFNSAHLRPDVLITWAGPRRMLFTSRVAARDALRRRLGGGAPIDGEVVGVVVVDDPQFAVLAALDVGDPESVGSIGPLSQDTEERSCRLCRPSPR
jgi:hypothetical protein